MELKARARRHLHARLRPQIPTKISAHISVTMTTRSTQIHRAKVRAKNTVQNSTVLPPFIRQKGHNTNTSNKRHVSILRARGKSMYVTINK